MSHYDEVLKEARAKATGSAKEYIPKLYHILVDEENKSAEDARAIIEHDLLEYWAKSTVRKFLPHEAKDEIKQEAGKKGAEKKKIMLLTDGSSADKIPAEQHLELPDPIALPLKKSIVDQEDDEEPTQEELALITEQQTQTISNKTSDVQSLIENKILTEENIFEWLSKREDKMKFFYYGSCATGFIKSRILANLENSGITVFKRLYFEV